jgi:hypothetical protein
MEKTRKQAIWAKAERYNTRKPCGRGHLSERFTSSGVCVACNEENNAQRWKGERGAFKRAQWELLQAGGARSIEQAVEHKLDWYLVEQPLQCGHPLVKLDGFTCQLCEKEDGQRKQQLEIAAKLLS